MDNEKLLQAVTKIKSFFTDLPIDTAVEMKEMTLSDGTKIKVSGEFVEGSLITIVNVDGSEMPAPDGELVLEDSTVITVKDGAIASIVPAVAMDGTNDDLEMSAKFDALNVSYDELKSKYDELLKATTESKFAVEKFSKELKALQEIQRETFSVVEQLAGLPSGDPVEVKASTTKTKHDKFAQLGATLLNLKK